MEAENIGVATPNYVFVLGQDSAPETAAGAASQAGSADQYVVDKLRLAEVHKVATGKEVLIAVIDSKVDSQHPDLAGSIAEEYDAVGRPDPPHTHGTGMIGAIAAQRKLLGIAPNAKILAVHAFATSTRQTPEATTRQILAGIEWAIQKGARIINMSFAGRYDPMIQLAMKNAHEKGVILIAAAGNMGPKSPPLYPAADPNVIAVTATDDDDQLFTGAVRGPHLAVAAPGVDIMVPAPEEAYQLTTGTSVAAAHVSGVAALLLERHPDADAATILEVLTSTATKLNPKGRDDRFGWGLVDPALRWRNWTTGSPTARSPRSGRCQRHSRRKQAQKQANAEAGLAKAGGAKGKSPQDARAQADSSVGALTSPSACMADQTGARGLTLWPMGGAIPTYSVEHPTKHEGIMSIRPVKRIVQSKPTMEGAGVKLHRAFGFGNTTEFDPFLLFDDFRNDRPDDYRAGFPWHPHRGIETITYVLAGTVEHGDSLGNKGKMGARRRAMDDRRLAASCIRRCRRATRRAACTASSSGRTCPPRSR